jgi:hypothetical protein
MIFTLGREWREGFQRNLLFIGGGLQTEAERLNKPRRRGQARCRPSFQPGKLRWAASAHREMKRANETA